MDYELLGMGGKYIGRRSGDYLFSKIGNPLGVFYDDELYDFSGKYSWRDSEMKIELL